MVIVNQTRPYCVNQMGKTHSKPLAARHGRGMAWERHAMCVNRSLLYFISEVHVCCFSHVIRDDLLVISLDNDQLDAHLLYFTISPLQSSTCFKHYMLIIRRLNCIHAASGIVILSKWPSGHNICTGRPLTERTIPDAA
jgi:hypothetical protein